MKQYRNLFIILTVALFLTACGGGGGTSLVATGGGGSGSGGGGTTAPPVVQKDIATLVMEAETAVGEIDAVNPTQAQVDAANMAIMAANDAIGALEAGDEKTMHMTRLAAVTVRAAELAVKAAELAVMAINATEPTQDQVDTANTAIMAANTAVGALEDGGDKTDYTTDVTVAGQRVSIFTAIMAADMAVKALEPLHEVTKAKVEAANQAINNVVEVVAMATAVTEGTEIAGYLATARMLGQSDPITMAREFVADALGAAENAETAAETAGGSVNEAIASGPIAAFEAGTMLSAAMGVSKGITDPVKAAITMIEEDEELGIAHIELQLLLATRAKMNLDDDLVDLKDDLKDLKDDLGDAQGKLDNGLEEDVNTLLAESLWYDEVAGSHEAALGLINVDIAALEQEIANADAKAGACETGSGGGGHAPDACTGGNTDSVLAAQFRAEAAQHRMELEAIKTGETKYTNTLKIIEIATETTDDHEKGDVIGVISDDEKEYTYDDLKTSAGENRQTATDRQTEHGTKEAELTATNNAIATLPNKISTKETEIVDKNAEIVKATEHVAAIKGILDPLKATLQGVVGDTAAYESEKAEQVLDMLAENLKAVTEDGVLDVDLKTNYTPHRAHDQVIEIAELDDGDKHVFARAPAPAGTMTFEEIANANAAWVLQERTFISSGSTNTAAHQPVSNGGTGLPKNHLAIALASSAASNFVKQDGTSPAEPLAPLDFHHGKLNGIEGTLYCDRSTPCTATSTSAGVVFGEGWYFTPVVNSSRHGSLGYNTKLARYIDSDGDGTYELVSYVDYGMWLEGADDELVLHRRVNLVGPSGPPSTLDYSTPGSATYSGDARGLSARTVGTGDDAVTASGHFEADVTLNATFGTSPELGGMINNFRPVEGQGDGHVNTDWSLTLIPESIPTSGDDPGIISEGHFQEVFRNGSKWNATPYGENREHPDGFYGGFNAIWTDDFGQATGAAAGVYSTEKQ